MFIIFSYKLIFKISAQCRKQKMSIKKQQEQIQAKYPEKAISPATECIKQALPKSKGWNLQEQYLYFLYLIQHRNVFKYQQTRKREKVFSNLSKLITSRSPIQIKTHHHKMLNRHKSVHTIIEYFTNKLQNQIQNDLFLQYKQQVLNRKAERFFEEEQEKKNEYRLVPKNESPRMSLRNKSQKITKNEENELKNEPVESNIYKMVPQDRQYPPCKILCEDQVSYIICEKQYQ